MGLPHLMIAMGLGPGGVTSHADENAARGLASTVQATITPIEPLDVVLDLGALNGLAYSPDPTLASDVAVTLVGARITPLRRRDSGPSSHFEPLAVFFEVDAGLALLSRSKASDWFPSADMGSAAGGVLGGAIGWMPMRNDVYEVGIEVTQRWAFFNHDAGTRSMFGAMGIVSVLLR